MVKGQIYSFGAIKEFADENNFNIMEYGEEVIGENFFVLKHDYRNLTVSFMLSSATANGFFYECVYSDLN